MKKKTSFFLGLLLMALPLSAQNKSKKTAPLAPAVYECLYEYKVKTPKGPTDTYATILQLGEKLARFMDYATYQTDSIADVTGVSSSDVNTYLLRGLKNEFSFDQTVYQNYPTGRLRIYSSITPDTYAYEEPLRPIQWALAEGTDTICGYVCKKATGQYGGRQWTAWYAPEIPASFGPWKLVGLPGLVLAAQDAEGIHHFSAIAFRKAVTVIHQPDNTNVINTTRAKFIKAKNYFEEDPMGHIPPESITDMSVLKNGNGSKTVLINGARLPVHPNGYAPLEKE